MKPVMNARASPKRGQNTKPKYEISAKFLEGGEKFILTKKNLVEEERLDASTDTTSKKQEDEEEGETSPLETRFEISTMLLLQIATLGTAVVALIAAVA